MPEDIQHCEGDLGMCVQTAPSTHPEYAGGSIRLKNYDLRSVEMMGQNVRSLNIDCGAAEKNVIPVEDGCQNVGSCINDDTNTIGWGDDVIPCTFKKGVCTLYKLKGDKRTIMNKKWAKKKFGYGWKEDSLHLSEWVRVVTIVC